MQNTITALADTFNQSINAAVFCDLLDAGIDPGIVWNAVYGETNVDMDINTVVPEVTEIDDLDDLVLADTSY